MGKAPIPSYPALKGRGVFMSSIFTTNSRQASIHLIDNELPKVNSVNDANNESSKALVIATANKQVTYSKDWPEDELSLSDAARQQLKEEQKANIDASDDSKHKSIMELAEEIKQKTIDDIKKRIKELTEELKKLTAQSDESSKEQAKLLQKQINDLNGQLLTIMTTE